MKRWDTELEGLGAAVVLAGFCIGMIVLMVIKYKQGG